MPNIKELLTGFCTKTLKMSADEVAGLFVKPDADELIPDALDKLLAKDATRVQEFTTERQTYFDNGYKKAQKEDRTKFEKEVKEKFGFDSTKQGTDLIQELITTKVSDAGQLSEEQVKAHPFYTSTVAQYDKKVKDTEKTWKEKVDTIESGIAKEKSLGTIRSKALTLVKSLNPILPEDAVKAENQLKWFENEINGYEYKDENGVIVIVKDNEIVKDKHGNLVTFDDFVKDKAGAYWDFKVGDGHTGTGAKTAASQAAAGKKGVKTYKDKAGVEKTVNAPKDKTEYSAMMAKAAGDANERIAIQEAWDEANTPAA